MDFLRKSKLFYGLIIVTLVLAILGLSYNVRFILQPIGVLLGVIIFPITTTGFLYYILLPLVQFLNKRIKRKNISILIVFILMGFCVCRGDDILCIIDYANTVVYYTDTQSLKLTERTITFYTDRTQYR